jgi:amino acid transporter
MLTQDRPRSQLAEERHLRKRLSTFDLVILGIFGAAGTGLMFSQEGMAAAAGPGLIISWIIGGIIFLALGLTFAELSIAHPEAGAPSRFSLYTHGRFTNIINAFADLLWYLFIPPIEALAVVEGLSFFYPGFISATGTPTLSGAGLGVVLLLLFIPFNYFGLSVFRGSNFVVGAIKGVLFFAVAIGLMALYFNRSNFSSYGGFAPLGFAGIFTAIPLAMFAYGGIRAVPDYAEESSRPGKMTRAIVITVLGQVFFYLLFAVAFVAGINWTSLNISVGSWASVGNITGNPFVALVNSTGGGILLSLVIALAVVSPFMTGWVYMGAGSRVLFAMGRSRVVSPAMKEIHRVYAIPYLSLIAFGIVGAIVAFLAAPVPTIYGIITDAVVAGYLGFLVQPVAAVVARRQGVIKNRVPGINIAAPVGFAGASLIVYWSGWPSVPYSVAIVAIAVALFSIVFRVGSHFRRSAWYLANIAWLTIMSYIGSVGALDTMSFEVSSALVVIVSLAVFFPWGIYSGLRQEFHLEELSVPPAGPAAAGQ